MKKEPNFSLSPTLGIIKVFSNNLSRLLPIFTVLQRNGEKQKYGVIEDSNKKAERFYSPGKVLHVYLSNHIKILLWSHIKFLFKSTEKVGIISKTTFAEHFRDG